jgi:oxygen-independent coproporphyrinogen-3 oxidase
LSIDILLAMVPAHPLPSPTLSNHPGASSRLGPRLRRLHRVIGPAHRDAEGLPFARALLEGQASPRQIAALLRALLPVYTALESHCATLPPALRDAGIPWSDLARRQALQHDVVALAGLLDGDPALEPIDRLVDDILSDLARLASSAPERFLAHVFVRYGGDLSGGQQLAVRVGQVLRRAGLPDAHFWAFPSPVDDLKQRFHDGIEQLPLDGDAEAAFLDEAHAGFHLNQRLLRALADLDAPAALPLELLLRHDRPVPRYTSYPTAQSFHAGVDGNNLMAELARPSDEPMSLYVHLPFCHESCWFCGCNRITTQAGSKAVGPYLDTLERELDLLGAAMPAPRPIAQLHWGGGTPNYLNPSERQRLWQAIARRFPFSPDLEASIEVNPERLDRDAVQQLRQLGFNRISFGLQDVDPAVQAAVNRVVPVEQLRRAMAWMREAAFESINVDVICGLPLQTPGRFAATIDEVARLRPDRISLFSFAYLPRQLPLQRRLRPQDLPSRQQRLAMLEGAHRRLRSENYDAIGMDHFALADDPLAQAARNGQLHRNFQGYSTRPSLDLLGVGVSAISLFPALYTQNTRSLGSWRRSIETGRPAVDRGVRLDDPLLQLRRRVIQELMCRFAVNFDDLGVNGPQMFADAWPQLQAMADEGLLELGANSLKVSDRGRWLVRVIAAAFDPASGGTGRGSAVI